MKTKALRSRACMQIMRAFLIQSLSSSKTIIIRKIRERPDTFTLNSHIDLHQQSLQLKKQGRNTRALPTKDWLYICIHTPTANEIHFNIYITFMLLVAF